MMKKLGAHSKTEKEGKFAGGYHHAVGVRTEAPANVVKEVITKLAT